MKWCLRDGTGRSKVMKDQGGKSPNVDLDIELERSISSLDSVPAAGVYMKTYLYSHSSSLYLSL